MLEKYFPSGIAEGDAFLGRHEETRRIINNLNSGQHTLLLAPRRHGKTSLARHVIEESGCPSIEIDLFVAQDDFSVENKFIKGVQSILTKIDSPENWIKSLIKYFKKADKTWTVGFKGVHLEIIPDNYRDAPENILESLNALEYALEEKNRKVIIFVDEFQQIALIENSFAIEGAIRHFAQSSKNVVFIFSGSSRHLLQQMFGDRSRPLFSLCDQISLKRLPQDEYYSYLQKISVKTWGKQIDNAVLQQIFELTECHPRYIYYFCLLIWDNCSEKSVPPSLEIVNQIWRNLAENKIKDFQEILNSKSVNYVKILAYISLGNELLTGQQAQRSLGISGSAINQALKVLQKEEYLEKKENGSYRMLDPVLKAIFRRFGADYFI